MSKKNNSQYEKLLSGTPQSAQRVAGGEQDDASDSGRGRNKKPGGLALSAGQLSLGGSQRHIQSETQHGNVREQFPAARGARGSPAMATEDNSALPGQPQAQLKGIGTPRALGHPPKPGPAGLGQAAVGRIPAQNGAQGQVGYRPDMQSAAAVTSRRKQNAMQIQGESGATSSTHPKIAANSRMRQAERDDAAQSSSGSPKSKHAAMGRETQNLFAISGQKSDDDEGDLDQFQSTRALRNRKLLGSDQVENDRVSEGDGSSPSKQLKKNSFNLKENSKFDMFYRNGRSIQELNVLKGAEGELQGGSARSYEGEAQPTFEKNGRAEVPALAQGRPPASFENAANKHRSMLLTPKSLGAVPGQVDPTDWRRKSANVTPTYSGSGPVPYRAFQPQEPRRHRTGAAEWTAGGAHDSIIEYENTEQKEHKAKGERMREIIERQMNAEYQNSVNKIIDGAQMNQLGVGAQKSGAAQKGKRQTRTAIQLNDRLGVGWEELHVRGFEDEDDALLRQQHQSFNLPSRVNDVGSFVNSGAFSMNNQASSNAGGSHLQPGEQDDSNGFYANDRADDGAVMVGLGGSRGKHPPSRRSQHSNFSVPGREDKASLTYQDGRQQRVESGHPEQQHGKPPVATGGKRREQARNTQQLGPEARAYANYQLGEPGKSSTSLAYSQQDQEEEIILDQDDVDKQTSGYVLLRAPGATDQYGPGYKAYDEAHAGPVARTRSAALPVLDGPRHGQSTQQHRGSLRAAGKSPAGRVEPRGAQAPESQKNSHYSQKIIAPGTGSLDGSGYHGREHVRPDADVSSFSGRDAGTHGHPPGGPLTFPTKGRHTFAKVNEEAAALRGNDDKDASEDEERTPLSLNSRQNSGQQTSAEKAGRGPSEHGGLDDKARSTKQRTSLSEFLSLSDHKKKTEDRRGKLGGYEQIDDDEEPAAFGDQASEKSAIEVDQIVGHVGDSLGEKSAATAQQLPASQRRRPRHAEGGHDQHTADGLDRRHGGEHSTQNLFYHGYAGLGFQMASDGGVGPNHEEASYISAVSGRAPGLKHTAVNVLQKNLSQSNGPQNSSYYKSDDLISSKQLEEQIVSCEQHLESLKQLKQEMKVQAASIPVRVAADLALATADSTQAKLPPHGRAQSNQRQMRLDAPGDKGQGEDDTVRANRMHAQSMRMVIGESSAKKQKQFQFIGGVSERSKAMMGDPGQQNNIKMPKVSEKSAQKLMSDEMDMVSPGLDSPRQQVLSVDNQPDRGLQIKQIFVEEVPTDQQALEDSSRRFSGLGEGPQVNRPLPVAAMAPSFAQKQIGMLQPSRKSTSPPPMLNIGQGLIESPRDNGTTGPFEIGRIERQASQLPSGRASYDRGGIRQSSKHEAIKLEKREKLFKEQLIRQFNQKLVDKVVSALKAKAKEGMDHVEEEQEAAEDDSNQPLSDHADPQQAQRARDALSLGRFLFEAKGLDKQLAGQYFGEDKKFNQAVCREFLRCFHFRNLSIDSCWRLIFNKMGLPKEGQQIVRIMTIFQDVYLEKNPEKLKWPKDTVWLVSVKLMDLNTNLHNPNVKAMLRYSRETFVQQSLLIPELKAAYSAEKIADMYDRIARSEFQSNVNLHEKYFKRINEMSYTLVQQGMKSGMKKPGKGGSSWQSGPRTVSVKRSTLQDAASGRNAQLLKTEGTIFTKYGRYGAPKQRLVYLNPDETAICWRDRINKHEKPRKLLIKDVRAVLIGADHTELMRKQKIPAQFDYQYISILATNRSLDLSIDDKKTVHLWCEKISRLLEARESRAQKCQHEASPELASPIIGHQSEAEVHIHTKDACPDSIVYLWKCELLNNLQNYWNPLSKEIYGDREIKFEEPSLKQAVLFLMEQYGAPLQMLSEQDKRSSSPSYFRNFSSNQESRAVAGQALPGSDRPAPKNAGAGSVSCGLGQKLSNWASASRPEPQPVAPPPSGSKMNKFFGMFNKKEIRITLVQTWHLGLPNIARYCLWPILIGNQLALNKSIFDSLLAQTKAIRRKAALQKTLEAGSAKQREGYAGRLSIGSAEGSGNALAQEQSGVAYPMQIKRASNLSMIVSENDKELLAEQNSVFDHAGPAHHKEIEDSVAKARRIVSGSNDTHDGGLDPASLGRPSTADAAANLNLDPLSEHMIAQFNKVQRKVSKLTAHWEKASVIGELADIPVGAFQQLMNDVLCAFLLHRASVNGLQGSSSELIHGNPAQFTLYQQRLEQSASFISGLEKVLAPLVLIHLREQRMFEPYILQKIAEQVFSCFTNLVLSTGGGSASQDQLFFLKHFITDDFSQIEWRMDFFDKLFAAAEPLLHGQFRGIDLKNEYFLHGWMMALFGNVQGLEGIEFVLRIWDLYLLHGEAMIYCVALAILKSKLHKLNNAPMQNWQDFFHKIKTLKLPQQSLHYPIGNLAQFQSPNHSQQSQQPGTGGSNSNEGEDPSHGCLGSPDIITNHDSHLMPALIKDSLSIFTTHNVPCLFKAHKMQQLVAEQKHEIFSKMYLNDDFC